jgi:NADH:ubiquinone oxidoreductase subunit 3 (subunit A)
MSVGLNLTRILVMFFDIRFCVIAILFIIFDIEIMFHGVLLFLDLLGFWSMIDFLFELELDSFTFGM